MMTFKEVAQVIQKRYKLSMATANQTAKSILDDRKQFESEKELNEYLDSLEELGRKWNTPQ